MDSSEMQQFNLASKWTTPMMPWELADLTRAVENFRQKRVWGTPTHAFYVAEALRSYSIALRNSTKDAYLLWTHSNNIEVSTFERTLWLHWNEVMQAIKIPLKFIGMVPPHAQIETPWGIRHVEINIWCDVTELLDPYYDS